MTLSHDVKILGPFQFQPASHVLDITIYEFYGRAVVAMYTRNPFFGSPEMRVVRLDRHGRRENKVSHDLRVGPESDIIKVCLFEKQCVFFGLKIRPDRIEIGPPAKCVCVVIDARA